MLSQRNVIITAVIVLVVSVIGACINLLQPPDSGGRGADSYGTHSSGYRALFELLEEVGVSAHRMLRPPQPSQAIEDAVLLLQPMPRIVALEPKYLQELVAWVERGGRLVVAPASNRWVNPMLGANGEDATGEEVTVFEAIGLPELELSSWDTPTLDDPQEEIPAGSLGDLAEVWGWRDGHAEPPEIVPVACRGQFEGLAIAVQQLAVPADGGPTIAYGSLDPSGTIVQATGDGGLRTLLASFSVGEGEVIVVAEPQLFSNQLVARADNSVLAVRLIADPLRGQPRRAVLFDEFYHGLSVRGNPLYLLTRPAFATVAAGLLLAVLVGTWRAAIYLGPPLAEGRRPRRDIGEYVEAMARFFSAGRGSRRFLIEEVRSGVLRQLCEQLHLPLDTPDSDRIVAALVRHNPRRVEALQVAERNLKTLLETPGRISHDESIVAMQRIVACL